MFLMDIMELAITMLKTAGGCESGINRTARGRKALMFS
jgi:hypothetical protein